MSDSNSNEPKDRTSAPENQERMVARTNPDPQTAGDRADAAVPERKQSELGQGDTPQRTKE